jgi:hypothetical protein
MAQFQVLSASSGGMHGLDRSRAMISVARSLRFNSLFLLFEHPRLVAAGITTVGHRDHKFICKQVKRLT